MKRFPFSITVTKPGETVQQDDGTYGTSEPVKLIESECNRLPYRGTQEKQAANGSVYIPSWKIVLPNDVEEGLLKSCLGATATVYLDGTLTNTLTVKDYYKSGQKYENTMLWL